MKYRLNGLDIHSKIFTFTEKNEWLNLTTQMADAVQTINTSESFITSGFFQLRGFTLQTTNI